jgi:hypothetical protein
LRFWGENTLHTATAFAGQESADAGSKIDLGMRPPKLIIAANQADIAGQSGGVGSGIILAGIAKRRFTVCLDLHIAFRESLFQGDVTIAGIFKKRG